MTEWPKVHDWKSCELARVPRVRIPLSPPVNSSGSCEAADVAGTDEGGSVCTSVCTPPSADVVRAAIDRLTHALSTAADDVIPELVAERAALRAELEALRVGGLRVAKEGRAR